MRYVYGIGPTRAQKILEETGIDPDKRTQELSEQDLSLVSNYIIDNKIMVEGDLRRQITNNLKRLQSIRSYRGLRHQRGLQFVGKERSPMRELEKADARLLVLFERVNLDITFRFHE